MRWINARAGLDRSDEEISILHAEMGMIYSGYHHMAKEWRDRAEKMSELGYETHAASAWTRDEIWLEFAERAGSEFNSVAPGIIQ